MHPAIRDHRSSIKDQNVISDASGLDCSDAKDMARQEFKDEADINYMLSRFNITQPRGTPIYGEWDDSIDLMTAFTSIAEAREAYAQLPENLRQKFTKMEDLLTALNNGSLVIKNEDAPADPPAETK